MYTVLLKSSNSAKLLITRLVDSDHAANWYRDAVVLHCTSISVMPSLLQRAHHCVILDMQQAGMQCYLGQFAHCCDKHQMLPLRA
jgi:hypothetical protein